MTAAFGGDDVILISMLMLCDVAVVVVVVVGVVVVAVVVVVVVVAGGVPFLRSSRTNLFGPAPIHEPYGHLVCSMLSTFPFFYPPPSSFPLARLHFFPSFFFSFFLCPSFLFYFFFNNNRFESRPLLFHRVSAIVTNV